MDEAPRLRATGIEKRYGRRPVLRGVDLVVGAGQVAAVVGENGSGKSTFLKICAGLVSPDQGEVVVRGTLGYCPQDTGLLDFLRPDEHFVLYGAGRSLGRETARRAGREAVGRLGWSRVDRRPVRELSGGTRQKLNVALSLVGEPDVLLLDEPYQGFDRGSYVDFWDCVWTWRDTGKAVVVVTHLLHQLDRVDLVLDLSAESRAGART